MSDDKELEEGEIIDISDTDSPLRPNSYSEIKISTTSLTPSKLILQCIKKSPVTEKLSPKREESNKNDALSSTGGIKNSSEKNEVRISFPNLVDKNELETSKASISLLLSDKENNQSIQNELDVMAKEKISSDTEDLDILFARQELIRQQLEKSEVVDSGEQISSAAINCEKNAKNCLETSTSINSQANDDSQDMDELIFRHELIKQQLTLVNESQDNSSESTGGEKSKKKKKGKKKRKLKTISVENSNPLLSPVSPADNNHTLAGILPHGDPQLNAKIDEELFSLRQAASKLSTKTDGLAPSTKVPRKLKIKTMNYSANEMEKLKDVPPYKKFGSMPLNIGEKKLRNKSALSKSALKRRKKKAKKLRMTKLNQLPRSGKSKNISYSEQQESEVKLLQSQQEAFDNYTNIPMEIEDDDTSINPSDFAPLPLIEMPEVRPPSPPREFEVFKPATDQTTLRMTRTNVAWMPGFVESLDLDFNAASPKIEYVDEHPSAHAVKLDETTHLKKEEVVLNEDDDADVWALRAQALKSLACKRAVRAKEMNKNKKSKAVEENVDPPKGSVPKLKDILTPEVQSPVTPISIKPADTIAKKRKTLYNKNPPPPPIHPCVIIPLRAEDFESSSSDSEEEDEKMQVRPGKVRVINRRRKAASDESLMRDLQSHIKRCRLRMKKNSSSIVKDQLVYKKLQNEISKQKILFEEQKEHCKRLQEELQLALKQKSSTSKTYNKLSGQFKELKDQLKEKIQVRNTTDEKILRAKSIVSVNRLRSNNPKNNARLKSQISSLIESLKTSYQALVSAEKLSTLDPNTLESSLNEIESDTSEIAERFNKQASVFKTNQHHKKM